MVLHGKYVSINFRWLPLFVQLNINVWKCEFSFPCTYSFPLIQRRMLQRRDQPDPLDTSELTREIIYFKAIPRLFRLRKRNKNQSCLIIKNNSPVQKSASESLMSWMYATHGIGSVTDFPPMMRNLGALAEPFGVPHSHPKSFDSSDFSSVKTKKSKYEVNSRWNVLVCLLQIDF